ncbi:co-chaperone protein p23-1 isoform X5 [Beta vulgaris subsp. vulgaris]|uniref:co-chaperone protein p23-1 isoform X5 n=1 Tax=Beta vulgaris subsp. vulgaris TaxID=3555 RepID=UPI002036F30C|nr:co-chaperone protein p23-1 isoform X5 [Beta vulgaris subsp. vulgaris]
MSRHPSVKWAQSSDKVYVTIELPDAKDVKLKLEPEGKMAFSAVKNAHPYEFDIELLDKINVEESKYNIGVRQIEYVIEKAEKRWWSRLIKQEGNPPIFLKVDWDKWVDENEENKNGSDLGGLSLSKTNQRRMKKRQKMNLWQQLKRLRQRKNPLNQWMKRLRQRKNPLNQWMKRLRVDCIKNQ